MRRSLWLLAVALLAVCGVLFFFFYRMGTSDAQALADFPVAYQNYDQAAASYSQVVLPPNPGSAATTNGSITNGSTTNDVEQKADAALAELNAKAAVRISSLTKNDGSLMQVMRQIAALSAKELDALKAYQRAALDKSGDLGPLAKEAADLSHQRQAAYNRYLELAGVKN